MIITTISEDKNTITIGSNTFIFIEEEHLKSSCKNCAFLNTDDCKLAPCMPYSREPIDRKEGHFEMYNDNSKKPYQTPAISKVDIDNDISLHLCSNPHN